MTFQNLRSRPHARRCGRLALDFLVPNVSRDWNLSATHRAAIVAHLGVASSVHVVLALSSTSVHISRKRTLVYPKCAQNRRGPSASICIAGSGNPSGTLPSALRVPISCRLLSSRTNTHRAVCEFLQNSQLGVLHVGRPRWLPL